jgi:hypothetical protein
VRQRGQPDAKVVAFERLHRAVFAVAQFRDTRRISVKQLIREGLGEIVSRGESGDEFTNLRLFFHFLSPVMMIWSEAEAFSVVVVSRQCMAKELQLNGGNMAVEN